MGAIYDILFINNITYGNYICTSVCEQSIGVFFLIIYIDL